MCVCVLECSDVWLCMCMYAVVVLTLCHTLPLPPGVLLRAVVSEWCVYVCVCLLHDSLASVRPVGVCGADPHSATAPGLPYGRRLHGCLARFPYHPLSPSFFPSGMETSWLAVFLSLAALPFILFLISSSHSKAAGLSLSVSLLHNFLLLYSSHRKILMAVSSDSCVGLSSLLPCP